MNLRGAITFLGGNMDFNSLAKDDLVKYLDFLMWNFRAIDGFWYRWVEDTYGREAANHLNEVVWDKLSGLEAREIQKRFNIQEKGSAGFLRVLKLFPWFSMAECQIDERPGEVTLSFSMCPQQEARISQGLGEYDCKEAHRLAFTSFARQVDPDIEVHCVHAPPDDHPPERYCRWRFVSP